MRRANQIKSTSVSHSAGRISQASSVDVYAVSLLSDEGDEEQPTFHINLDDDDDDEDDVEQKALVQHIQPIRSQPSHTLARAHPNQNENKMSLAQRRASAGSTSSGTKATMRTSRTSLASTNDESPQRKMAPASTISISRRAYAAALLMKDSPIEAIESPASLSKAASKPSTSTLSGRATTTHRTTVPVKPNRASTGGVQKVIARSRPKHPSGVASSEPSTLAISEDSSTSRNVRVIVRCCPSRTEQALVIRSKNEISVNAALAGKTEESRLGKSDFINPTLVLATENNHIYKFDTVLGPSCDQKGAFDEVAVVVEKFLTQGVPGAVLAYGQTATGKTHTMGLLPLCLQDSAGLGCIPRAVIRIFTEVMYVDVSAMELYLDTVQDLLADPPMPAAPHVKNEWDEPAPTVTSTLSIREKEGRFFVQGLRQVACGSAAEAWEVIKRAIERRTTRETEMNAVSSRSHTIISISVNGRELSFVDLAGSERVRKCQGDVKETAFINSSLASLGNVVRALASSSSSFAPFRESKLTRLLQQSLGQGNAALFATVSMDPDNIVETLSTLKFAEKCTSLTTKLTTVPVEDTANHVSEQEKMCTRAEERIATVFRVLRDLTSLPGASETAQDWLKMEDDAFHAILQTTENALREKLQATTRNTFVNCEDESDMQSIFSPSERRKGTSFVNNELDFDDPEAMYELL